MTPASLDEGVHAALRSITGDRLALLLGAGLSIPSGLPSAQAVADRAKQTYDGLKPPAEPPLPSDIEAQADFFLSRGELDTLYVQTLVDSDAFAGPPNDGHRAVADFLLTGAVTGAVSTNYDTLIEAAGLALHGAVGVALDGAQTTRVRKGAPLLKVHGCWFIDPLHTVWTPRQLDAPGTVQDRIRSSVSWLETHLPNRDLLVVGFGSDWSYLNAVLGRSLGQVTPPRVTIVDLNDPDEFRANAPDLTALGDRAESQAPPQSQEPAFRYVQASGEDFFHALRLAFSRTYVRRALNAGAGAFAAQAGADPDPAWLDPPFVSNDDLWHVRRDLEGCRPNQPARGRTPPVGEALGLALIGLQAAGAVPDGPYWRLSADVLVRVINGSNRVLHTMKTEYDREMTHLDANVVVALGADDSPLPGSVGRPNEGGSQTLPLSASPFFRGPPRHWVVRPSQIPTPSP